MAPIRQCHRKHDANCRVTQLDARDACASGAAEPRRQLCRDRYQRHHPGASIVGAACALVFPPYGGWLEARGSRAAMSDDKGLIERVLAPIADVRRGETGGALLLMLTMFLILGGYYLLKTAREIFILSDGGAEVKSYSSAGQALLLLFIVPAYGAFATRVNRKRLTQWVTLFFASNLIVFLGALSLHWRIGIAYFLWVGVFNVMVIAQYWAFANDLYTQEQGKRLFPLIGIGSSLGAWVGSIRAGTLLAAAGPWRLLAGAAAILVLCAGLAGLIDRLTKRSAPAERARSEAPLAEGRSGFGMILSDRYLMLIAVLILL